MEQNVKCTKPNCDCLQKAIEKNSGDDVKSYPCLHNNVLDMAIKDFKPKTMTFRTALISKKPLYIDGTMRVNFTVDELVNFVEDYLKDNQPILTVEVHEPVKRKSFDERVQEALDKIKHIKNAGEPVKHTQDNHLHTKF